MNQVERLPNELVQQVMVDLRTLELDEQVRAKVKRLIVRLEDRTLADPLRAVKSSAAFELEIDRGNRVEIKKCVSHL